MANNIALLPGNQIGIMRRPESHPIALPVVLNFTGVSRIEFDLEREQTLQSIDFVQTIYVDNSDNANTLTLTFPGGQRIVIPATAQGYYPVAATIGKFVLVAETLPGVQIPIFMLNVPVPSFQWGPVNVDIANVTATFTPTVGVAAAAAQVAAASAELFAANANAIRRIVRNPSGNINSVYINFGGVPATAAGDSLEIPPGGQFDTGTGPIDQTQWTVYAPANTTITKIQMVS